MRSASATPGAGRLRDEEDDEEGEEQAHADPIPLLGRQTAHAGDQPRHRRGYPAHHPRQGVTEAPHPHGRAHPGEVCGSFRRW